MLASRERDHTDNPINNMLCPTEGIPKLV